MYFSPPAPSLKHDATLGVGNRLIRNVALDGKVMAVFALPRGHPPRPIINRHRELGRLPRTARNHKLRLTFAYADEGRAFAVAEAVK